MLELAQLLNLPNDGSFDIAVPESNLLPPAIGQDELEEIFSTAEGLPRIRKAELALQQSKLQYKMQKGAALPTISFSAGYSTFYSDNQRTAFFTQFDNNRNPSMGFSLNIPIFNNWRNNTAIRNARSNMESSRIGLEISRQELMKEIQLAFNQAQSSYNKMEAAAGNRDAAMESFKLTQEKFNLGMLNGTDYSTAKANLFKAESEWLQSKYQYIFQHKILDYYRNVPLTL